MKKTIRAEFRTDSTDLINFFIGHFGAFLLTAIGAAVISAAVSLAIKPLYESTVILYPSSSLIKTNSLLGKISSSAKVFGDDDATERLLQILKSEELKEYLKIKYDLVNHYNIKKGERYPNTKMEEKMNKYIRSSKTSFGSVEIRVRDRDRNVACLMANDIASRVDTIFNDLQKSTASKVLKEIGNNYQIQLKLVKRYEDSLRIISASGEPLSKEYLNAAASGKMKPETKQKFTAEIYKTGRPEFIRIFSTLESETGYLSEMRGKYIEYLALSNQTLPYTLVIDKAVVAEKKAWPKRSYFVIIATISSVLLLALILFISDSLVLHRNEDAGI